ncbi:hypothetical protein DMH12_32705 [Streptomyces sp. WAC 04229]|nr:hypothetical protein DMH12_32705 [Streptomyces sp. WAC 04229]
MDDARTPPHPPTAAGDARRGGRAGAVPPRRRLRPADGRRTERGPRYLRRSPSAGAAARDRGHSALVGQSSSRAPMTAVCSM